MVLVRAGTFSVVVLETEQMEDLLRCVAFLFDSIQALVLDARVQCPELPIYSVQLNTRGYSERVIESMCKFAVKHVDAASVDCKGMTHYSEQVMDDSCGWVKLESSQEWSEHWDKMLLSLKYMVCKTPIGYFWSREGFGQRRI